MNEDMQIRFGAAIGGLTWGYTGATGAWGLVRVFSRYGNCQARGSPLPRSLAIATVLNDIESIDQNKSKVKSTRRLVRHRRIPHV